jgi:hypothetical protein
MAQNYGDTLELVLWNALIMERSNGNVIDDDARREVRNETLDMFAIIFPNVISFLLYE